MSNGPTASQKLVLVTGGSRGLGRNSAIHAAKAGFDVILTYKTNAEAAAQVVAEIEQVGRKAAALRLDTSDVASFDGFAALLQSELKRLGHQQLFGLLNNAGIGLHAPFETTSEDLLHQLVNT